MSDIGIRPHFTDILPMDEQSARECLTENILTSGADCECKSFQGYLVIRIPESRRKFYSPRLILSMESTNGSQTRISGTFGPNANMWSAFLYAYLLTGSVALFSGILGFCQWKIGISSWGLWIFWPTFLILITLYAAARIGRRLGHAQTSELHSIYQSASGHLVEIL